MKKNIILLIIIVLFTACSQFTGKHDSKQSQAAFTPDSLWTPTGNAQLDSLLQLAAIAPQDTNLVMLYSEIADMYKNNDFEKAKAYYLKSGNLSEQLAWNIGYYNYSVNFSNMLNREGLLDSATIIIQKAYELAVHENDEKWKSNMLMNKGNVYYAKDWYETALSCYMEGLPYLEKENNVNKLHIVYYLMSQLYRDIGSADKAIEYGEKSVALNRENPAALSVLGTAYEYVHQYEKALFYYEESSRLCALQNNIYIMGHNYYNLSNIALYLYDLKKAERYALQSLEIHRQFDPEGCCNDLVLLSKIEQLKSNYLKSEGYAKEALQIAVEFDSSEGKKYCYQILSELASIQGRYREYIQYWEEMDLAGKAMATETALRASEEMNAKYETAKKDFEIERQQHMISRHIMQRWMLAAGIAVCMLFLALLWYMLRLRTRRNHALTERNDVLSEMNATKDKFFSIISHDLKNPAVAQRDAIQLLVKNDRVWNADTLTEYYAGLLNSADGQVELLYNLLNWAKIQTGRMAYTPTSFALAAHFRSDLALIRNMAEKKGIAFEVAIPDDAMVTGDPNMIITVLRNLLTNAVKFTASGGTVALEITEDRSDKASAATTHTLTISDTGTGMSAAQISNLFNLDNAHSGRGTAGEQGSGLGLIVCKELLEKHGSALHIESKEGKGSRFWFAV